MAQEIVLYEIDNNNRITVSQNKPTQVIAEAGVLTFGEKETGFKFVDEAKRVGIKLLKFQSFVPENVVSRLDMYWLERMKQRALSQEDFLEIMKYGKERGVTCFASTHNEYDLVELAEAGMPILKIGAGDSNNYRMIDMAIDTGKPVILSLGLLSKQDTKSLLDNYRERADQLIVMHCTTLYPTPPELANLKIIKELKQEFPEFNLGYSDHTSGYNITLAAAGMDEVVIIEKHFCLPEHKVKPKFESMDILSALTPDEFRKLLVGIEEIHSANAEFKEVDDIFKHKKWAHKAICAQRDIMAGDIIKPDDLMSIRPYIKERGHVSIDRFYDLVDKKLKRNIQKGEYLLTDDL